MYSHISTSLPSSTQCLLGLPSSFPGNSGICPGHPGSQASSRGKQRTPLSSRVAPGISWAQLSGLKGVNPPVKFGERTRNCSPGQAGKEPWTAARQALLSMGFSRQEYWSGWPCRPPGDLPDLMSFMSPVLSSGFFTTGATWEAIYQYSGWRRLLEGITLLAC